MTKTYLSPDEIISITADYFRIPSELWLNCSRKREYIKCKHIAMYCFRQFTDLSFQDIGMICGGKDHATVMHAIKKINGFIDSYEADRKEMELILKKMKDKAEDNFKKYVTYNTENA